MFNIKSFALILLLGLMWGPSFLFIKLGLEGGIPPLTLATLRVGFAAIFLWVFVIIRNSAIPDSKRIFFHAAIIAIFSQALPFALINIAEQYIDSALAGIINGITPIATALFAHLLIHDEKLTWRKTFGILLGIGGFLVLLLPSLWNHMIDVDTLSIIGVGLAALCYAIGIIYGRLFLRNTRTLALPALQISFATLYLLPFAFFVEGIADFSTFTLMAWGSVLFLAFWGTACAFIVYFYVLQQYGALALGTSTFLLPIFSIFFGVVFLDEQLSWLMYAGTILILSGMKLVHSR
jgi:drug/metabolite transporter (DMT)-like permease